MPNVPFTRASAAQHAEALFGWFLGLAPDTAGRVTDFNVGSNVRTYLEAIAHGFERLDVQTWLALLRAIPTVLFEFFGEGDGLTTFVGFPRLPALPASGLVRYVAVPGHLDPIAIPVGRRFQVLGTGGAGPREYTTTAPATVAVGVDTLDVEVRAVTPGAASNTPAQTLVPVETIPGIASATNPAALINGADQETDEARRVRFTRYLRELARSTEAGLEVGARMARVVVAGQVVEQVQAVQVSTVPERRGLIRVYLDNGGGTASVALIQAAQLLLDGSREPDGTRIPGYKAAGVVVEVLAVVAQPVDVAATVTVEAGFGVAAVRSAVTAAITATVAELGVFADCIVADLICAVQRVRGVRDVVITSPAQNVVPGTGVRLIPGVVTVA